MNTAHIILRQPFTRALALVGSIVIVLSSFANAVRAAASDLDATFGNGGKVTAEFFNFPESVRAVALQPDGKIVVAGSRLSTPPPQTFQDVALGRFNPDGSPDTSFGSGGFVAINLSSGSDEAYAVGLQSDGKIVVGGYGQNSMGKPLSLLARFTADGQRDTSFTIRRGVDFSAIYAIAILPDDKIVALTYVEQGSVVPRGFLLSRYNPDGSFDTSFNGNGLVSIPFTLGYRAAALAVQPDGRIIIGGGSPFTLLRYNANGTPDSGFGNGGVATANFPAAFSSITALALQSDGRIVGAGLTGASANGPFDFALARFNSDGALDQTFSGDGKVVTDFFGDDDAARALVIQPDGQLIAVGYARRAGNYDFALARYNVDGSLDAGFGTGGKATTDFNGGNDKAYAAALDADGKLVAAGNTAGAIIQGALARYQGSSSSFDLCLQDEKKGNILKINSETGEYLFINCGGVMLGGTGTLARQGNHFTLQHNTADRNVQANIFIDTGKANATIKIVGGGPAYTINDKDITNNSGTCP
ncbi:MAG: hypothetical protein ACJ74J_08745 [Blastocatellia bacterium]